MDDYSFNIKEMDSTQKTFNIKMDGENVAEIRETPILYLIELIS